MKELRIALVCYGGVSLAIYMHGMTKELHKLVLASTAFERDPEHNPFPPRTAEGVYWDLLARIKAGEAGTGPAGVRLRVVIDIVSGTSAGGINGVFLAKAMAGNRSPAALRKLWFEQGDIRQLLRGNARIPLFLRAMWLAKNPLRIKPPLRGDAMCRWLYEALSEMDRGHELDALPTLVPDDHQLDLFVPVTDFQGYDRDIPLEDPRFVRDRTHRHIMRFRHRQPGPSDFGPENNHMLAFAARATSSFPGAFPPVNFERYKEAFGGTATLDGAQRFFPLYPLAGVDPATAWFIDGGVLDNFPFGAAIDAIAAKPAACEVDRRLLYIEPDPGGGHAVEESATPPGLVRTVLAGYAGIPRQEPILDDLQNVARRNETVLRIRDVIETSFDTVSARVTELLAAALAAGGLTESPAPEQLAAFRAQVEAAALAHADYSADTYVRLRVRTVVDAYADAVCQVLGYPVDSYQATFVADAMRRWAVNDGLFDQWADATERPRRMALLARLDLQYHDRRLRLLIAALSWFYRDAGRPGYPSRPDLDVMKGKLYSHVFALRAITDSLAADTGLQRRLAAIFAEPDIAAAVAGDEWPVKEFVEAKQHDLVGVRDAVEAAVAGALPAIESAIHADLLDFLRPLDPAVAGAMLTRYVGFPFWDVLVFPIQAMSGVGERDHVEVYRMSPLEATLLTPEPDRRRKKLTGVGLSHFGAFFTRPGREQDYLWGRLDGAERLVKLLLDTRKEPPTMATAAAATVPPGVQREELARACQPLFAAILDEERGALPNAGELVTELDGVVKGLA